MDEPASQKQIFLMNKLKIVFPADVSKAEASKLIDEKMGNKPKDVTTNYPNVDTLPSLDDRIRRQVAFKGAIQVVCTQISLHPNEDWADNAVIEVTRYFTDAFDRIL